MIQLFHPREDGLTLWDCVCLCANDPKFVKEFDRLTKSNLSLKGSGIILMIDQCTGKLDMDLEKFIRFVHDAVFLRCPLGGKEQ